MAVSTTVIEDMLESIGNVPNSVKRNFELMRELDSEMSTVLEEVNDAEAAVLAAVKRKLGATPTPKSIASVVEKGVLEAIAKKRRKCDDLQDEKILIAEQTSEMVAGHVEQMNSELASLSAHLHATGEFESSSAARPGDEVAIRLEDDNDAWILARVVRYKPDSAHYDVADADDDRKVYELPETRVVPLTDSGGRNGGVAPPHALAPVASVLATLDGSAGGDNKISKGDEVFAVYPDTTSFYPATISRPPRRGGDSGVCHVQFNDDADETGLNPDRVVPLKYVIRFI